MMDNCLCCRHSAAPGPGHFWHVHPRCPVHGEPQWRGVSLTAGEFYGACQRDHEEYP